MEKSQSVDENAFWTYAGIIIPNTVKHVTSLDGYNKHFQNGSETEKFSNQKGYTKKEYQEKFAAVGADGKLYWKK
jgi:hypothetical protein